MHRLLAATLILLCAGCVTAPVPLQGQSPTCCRRRPPGSKRPARWFAGAGRIVSVEPQATRKLFRNHRLLLDARGEPRDDDRSEGRFFACRDGFYDPEVFQAGRGDHHHRDHRGLRNPQGRRLRLPLSACCREDDLPVAGQQRSRHDPRAARAVVRLLVTPRQPEVRVERTPGQQVQVGCGTRSGHRRDCSSSRPDSRFRQKPAPWRRPRRRSSRPAKAGSSAGTSLSVATPRLGTNNTCTGACGAMSLRGNDVLVLEDDVGGDLAADDAVEDAVGHGVLARGKEPVPQGPTSVREPKACASVPRSTYSNSPPSGRHVPNGWVGHRTWRASCAR